MSRAGQTASPRTDSAEAERLTRRGLRLAHDHDDHDQHDHGKAAIDG